MTESEKYQKLLEFVIEISIESEYKYTDTLDVLDEYENKAIQLLKEIGERE